MLAWYSRPKVLSSSERLCMMIMIFHSSKKLLEIVLLSYESNQTSHGKLNRIATVKTH